MPPVLSADERPSSPDVENVGSIWLRLKFVLFITPEAISLIETSDGFVFFILKLCGACH
jgi:hypothetical protein